MHFDGDPMSLFPGQLMTTDGIRIVIIDGSQRTDLCKNMPGNSDFEFFQFGLAIIPDQPMVRRFHG